MYTVTSDEFSQNFDSFMFANQMDFGDSLEPYSETWQTWCVL